MKHRWGDKVAFPLANKSECECRNCGLVKVSRHECEGGRDVYWTEFWCDMERIEGDGTPPCLGRERGVEYDARSYPL
ncbi:hypothetical protein [Bradyrhizobium sp.]|uniref:hypothetical protein n=1 Tax=Bradyrhizobium sp. TaxID=376 RepID=UPI003C50CF89